MIGVLFITQMKCIYIFNYYLQINKSTFTKIEENTEKKNTAEKGRATIIFSLKNEVGGLVKALKLFQVCTHKNLTKQSDGYIIFLLYYVDM